MKIIFFGSDDFAAVHLKALIDSKHHVAACVTQPDRPKERGMKIVLSKIKEYAQVHQIPVLQPPKINNDAFVKELRSFDANLFVVIAYGQFIPKSIREMPRYEAINVHPSLLPKYRGAAPINWAVINGDKETGISIIKIIKEMDAGDILAVTKIKIDDKDTSMSLRTKMMDVSPGFLLKTIGAIEENNIKPVPQKSRDATMAPKLTKDLGAIEWTKTSKDIYNLIRGALPWPSAYTTYRGKSLKLLDTHVVKQPSNGQPGAVLDVNKEGIIVATGDGGLLLKKVHLQDSKPMGASAFVRGHKIEVGFQFK